MPDSITLKRVGYRIKGVSKVLTWMEGHGYIRMTPFELDTDDEDEIRKNINDGGFGVQKVEGAVCEIYELFEHNFELYRNDLVVGDITEEDMESISEMYEGF